MEGSPVTDQQNMSTDQSATTAKLNQPENNHNTDDPQPTGQNQNVETDPDNKNDQEEVQ